MAGRAPAVLIPAAPRDDVVDTAASVNHYLPDSPVVVLDDGLDPNTSAELAGSANVLPSLPYPRNAYGGLWLKVCYGFKYILANVRCSAVIRLDADALLIGPGLEVAIRDAFDRNPETGLLGGFRRGPDNGWRDFAPMGKAMAAETLGLRSWRQPTIRRTLRPLVEKAMTNGYELGDHAIACVTAIRTEMLSAWLDLGLLDLECLATSAIGDDGFLGLLTGASGYRIGEMGAAGDPIQVAWRGLPADPETLVSRGALAVHSVRSWGDLVETDIRRYFAERRVPSRASGA